MDHKICITCKASFPATTEFFHRAPGNKFGLSSYCKPCKKSVNKKWSDSNKDQHKASRERWKKENHSPTRKAWEHIKQRCFNENCRQFKYYGARGITMCERWRNSFEDFVSDVGERPGSAYTIERSNNNGNYEPGNVVWATRKEQARNKRNNRLITHDGKTQCLKAWAEEYGIHVNTLQRRLDTVGMEIGVALTTPVKKYK